jgi:hypothetical protein
MRFKNWTKRTGVLALLVLVLPLFTATSVAAPQQQDVSPEAIACGDTIVCSRSGPAVSVTNNGIGAAYRAKGFRTAIRASGLTGVFGSSWGGAGVKGKSTNGPGLKGASINDRGVSGSGVTGVYGESDSYSGEGVHGHGTGFLTEGVLGTSAQNVGVYGISNGTTGNNIGVWAQTAGTWGFFSNQSIQVNGCTGCTFSFVAVNAQDDALEVGDVVTISGVASPLRGQQTPLLKVQRASTATGAFGVVQSRAEVTTSQARTSSGEYAKTEEVEIAGMTGGSVQPGDYLLIVVQGLVQVRADAGSGIRAGDRLVAGDGGRATRAAPEAQIIGQAVDAVDPTTGLVWVLVDSQ